ncbi:MAG: toll/interleukin-1 receptor domain-containing protein [Chloroflexi bacterium]|nr:MAG: toll/interleukin-1 receptor domain-containing protein [Chloroflexota bacterium]
MSHVYICLEPKDMQAGLKVHQALMTARLPVWMPEIDPMSGLSLNSEIDHKLEEAFAVALLVSPAAMQSTAVTYQWSKALGMKKPVVPLMVADVSMSQVPNPLRSLKFFDCRHAVPKGAIDELLSHYHLSPQSTQLLRLVYNAAQPLRVLARVLIWSYGHVVAGRASHESFYRLVDMVDHYYSRIYEKAFVEINPNAVSNGQQAVAQAATFVSQTSPFFAGLTDFDRAPSIDNDFEDLSGLIEISEEYREGMIEPLFDSLAGANPYYEALERYLSTIDRKPNPLQQRNSTFLKIQNGAKTFIDQIFARTDAEWLWQFIEGIRRARARQG